MDDMISPKYQMKLVGSVQQAIWEEYKSYKDVMLYIKKWHISDYDSWNNYSENFRIVIKENEKDIDLQQTLHSMSGLDLLRVAIDLGVDTPDFIPSIPIFKNDLKSSYKTAYDTFTKAFKHIEEDPNTAIGLANSALESIIKEILKDARMQSKINGGETLYKLISIILKEFRIADDQHPVEMKTIANSLSTICQQIEKLRSEKTTFHGKTSDDYIVNEPVYSYFIINAATTVGLFLNSYYQKNYPAPKLPSAESIDDLPF